MRLSIDEPRTLSDAAFQRLRSDIVSGVHKPGTKLKIGELVTHYDIGASPLREALARLSSEHLVILQGQRGFTVAPISQQELDDLINVRQLVECDAVARSLARGDVEWEARIVAAYFRLHRAHQTSAASGYAWSPEWERCNREFHDAIVSECGSPWLLRMQHSLYAQCERYRRLALTNPRLPRDGDAEHKAIMDACLARKTELAKRLTAEHIGKTAQTVASLLPGASEDRPSKRLSKLVAKPPTPSKRRRPPSPQAGADRPGKSGRRTAALKA